MNLSTRPEKFVGDLATWEEAEDSLRRCLDNTGLPWTLNPGGTAAPLLPSRRSLWGGADLPPAGRVRGSVDGAFYGPKIDFTVTDALKRKHQTATIQVRRDCFGG